MSQTEAIELLATALKEFGIDQAPIRTDWLTGGGFVVGRRFECGPIKAVWFFDENEMKFYDEDGKLLRVSGRTTTTAKAA
jgi:hypothetical protein